MLKRNKGENGADAPSGDSAALDDLELSFAKVSIFSACSKEELLHVARLCTLREVTVGEAAITEGEAGDEFFVILRGDVVVTRGGAEVAQLHAGDFFGELALFDPAPRNATVTATSPLSLAVLSKPAFRKVLEDEPIRDGMFLGMARRLRQLDAGA
jgi:CRP-like cAMP-binding protein